MSSIPNHCTPDVATHRNTLQHTATHCNTLQQCVAVCCSVLRCVAVTIVLLTFSCSWSLRHCTRLMQPKDHEQLKVRCTGCLILTGHFPQKSPIISGSFAKNSRVSPVARRLERHSTCLTQPRHSAMPSAMAYSCNGGSTCLTLHKDHEQLKVRSTMVTATHRNTLQHTATHILPASRSPKTTSS